MTSDGVATSALLVAIVLLAAAGAALLLLLVGVPLPAVTLPPVQPRAVSVVVIALLGALVGAMAARGEPMPAIVRIRRRF